MSARGPGQRGEGRSEDHELREGDDDSHDGMMRPVAHVAQSEVAR